VLSECFSTRVQRIQAEMTSRAIELLNLGDDAPPAMLLDIGCGSGLSGELLDEAGHIWVGMDVAPSMLGAPPSTLSNPLCTESIARFFQRSHWSAKLRAIYFYMISGKGSRFERARSTGLSGASPACMYIGSL